MSVMNAQAPGALTGDDEDTQAIAVILSTPLGTRLARRDFGSDLSNIVDQPMNAGTRQRLLGATVVALMRWRPSLKIARVQLEQTRAGWTVIITRPAGTGSSRPVVALLTL